MVVLVLVMMIAMMVTMAMMAMIVMITHGGRLTWACPVRDALWLPGVQATM